MGWVINAMINVYYIKGQLCYLTSHIIPNQTLNKQEKIRFDGNF